MIIKQTVFFPFKNIQVLPARLLCSWRPPFTSARRVRELNGCFVWSERSPPPRREVPATGLFACAASKLDSSASFAGQNKSCAAN